MRTVIVEDEIAASQALEKLISEVAPDTQVVEVLQSVDESVEWFSSQPMPDLVFMDIHLADGSSFSIFDEVEISCPIIFTTAYDQYALRAFEVNSIDYLLKPVDKERLKLAMAKFRNISRSEQIAQDNSLLAQQLLAAIGNKATYKSSLLIPVKDKLVPMSVRTIAYIYTENSIVHVVDFSGNKTVVPQTLEEIYSQLDPARFYRANRQYIVSRDAVKDLSLWFNGRLSVNLTVRTPERIIVSRLNAKDFKNWLMQ